MQVSETEYTFSVLQYRHDAWIGEALNVGVLMSAPDAGFLEMKVRTTNSRLAQAYPDLDTKGFQQLLWAIQSKVTSLAKEMRQGSAFKDELTSSSVARRLLSDDDSALHWLEPGAGITSSPKEELARLFTRYVSRWDADADNDARIEDDLFALRRRQLSAEYKLILRSVYYRQAIPKALWGGDGSAVSRRLEALELAGLIDNTKQGRRLTGAGVRALKQAFGRKKPPFIDFKHDARLPQKEQKKQFIVGNSLASELAREVRDGE